tara:strand:- start:91 stop:474 length:384 start_codon:yes stop_codon:yes gene_type:complete
MRVDIYYNLHRKCFSVRSMELGRSYRKVIAHRDAVLMKDCSFVVSESGRQRVLRDRRKNVHTFVRGLLPEEGDVRGIIKILQNHVDELVMVRYNPYVRGEFYELVSDKPITNARYIFADGKNITALL